MAEDRIRQYPLRMPAELYEWLAEKAAREHRSINNLIVHWLTQVYEAEKKPQA